MAELKPCGTAAAYSRHRRANETPCDECRKAANLERYRWAKTRPAYQPIYKLRDKILDVLTIDPGGWTTAGLSERLGCHVESADRTLRQLYRDGLVAYRDIELAKSGDEGGYDRRREWRVT